MRALTQRHYLLPLILALLGLLLLLRVFLVDTAVFISEDLDVVALVALLAVTMVVAIHTIVRISTQYLRLLSVRRARRETLAEHARFLRRLDHELKNPLTALRAGLSTLELTGLNEQQQQIVAPMVTETLRLSRLVTDLRKLAELETQPLNLQPVNVEAFVAGIIQTEQERFAGAGRELTSRVRAAEPVWVLDEDLLALAVHNLLDNAFKYTHPGATVHLELSAGEELTIRVADTGIGIPADLLPHVWEELYRADPAAKVPGSGIGLALVKVIAERHSGAVDIMSEPGKGTTVSMHLPRLA